MRACPFCGAFLKPVSKGATHPTDMEALCLLSGFFIGEERFKAWNKRAVLVKDVAGFPSFGYEEGRAMDFGVVQQSIDYLRKEEP